MYLRDRTTEELAKIKQLVSAAINIDESRGDKIEVMNLQFASNDMFEDTSEPGIKKYDLATLAQLMIVLIVIVIAAFLLFKPNFIKLFNKKSMTVLNDIPQSLQEQIVNNQDQNEVNAINKPFAEKQYEQLLRYLNDSAAADINNTVKILRNWITQNK